ncbi:hypothetical protein BCV69DRAFT_31184 [Microstroma glucosiphilum]|uniref:DUF7330 domain-containing protein n=1 Tax=Pseudomicrostroma glucosiphilum TaxID=1684307 RepID=A0A316U336_9BASI|nr:hypothetical protein BCV69DRAFT_31184 [Pseudomicrostroma glucosiphilum]PWN19736.1 hypothetical protein BCV69DRAFT_31184 [Pseudomicrostroma glucosiphilum]
MHFGSVNSRRTIDGPKALQSMDGTTLSWEVSKEYSARVPDSVALETRAGSIRFNYIEALSNVSLLSSAGGIHHSGTRSQIKADSVKVKANAGSIDGTYRVIDKLDLYASAGSVRVEVLLPGKQTSSFRSTADEDSYEQSSPHVMARSNAGSVHVRYTEQHPSVELHSDVASRAGTTEVQHAPNYQGTFHLASGAGSIHMSVDDQVKRCKTTVDRKRPAGGLIEGEVWIEREDGWSKKGSSSVVTDAGSVKVYL